MCNGTVVAGQGPPWCIAHVTATPVGQPPNTTRPARAESRSSSTAVNSASPAGSTCRPAVRLAGTRSSAASSSFVDAYSTSNAAGPNASSSSSGWAIRSLAGTASSAAATAYAPESGSVAAGITWRTPGTSAKLAVVRRNASWMRALSSGPMLAAATASASGRSSPCPDGRNSRPGLVQNCPLPSVYDPTKPETISSARWASAPGLTTTGFNAPSSP